MTAFVSLFVVVIDTKIIPVCLLLSKHIVVFNSLKLEALVQMVSLFNRHSFMNGFSILRLILGMVALSVLLLAAPYRTAHAAGIVVNTNQDNISEDDLCTLREAITTANSDTSINTGGSGSDCV